VLHYGGLRYISSPSILTNVLCDVIVVIPGLNVRCDIAWTAAYGHCNKLQTLDDALLFHT
jgi:hypothetical protein